MIDPCPEQRMMTIPQCPVTGGCPTRMTRRGFREACDRIKESITDTQRVVPLCFRCDGMPPELEIIKMEDFTMATKATKKKCELCTEKKATVLARGHNVCAICQKIFTDISKRNHLIDKARGMLGVECVPTAGESDTEGRADQLESCLDELAVILNSNGTDLTEVATARMTALDTMHGALMEREATIDDLRETVDTLRETVDTVATTEMSESRHSGDMARKLALIQTIVGCADVDAAHASQFVGDISAMAAGLIMAPKMGRTDKGSAA